MKLGAGAWIGRVSLCGMGPGFVDRLADHVHDPPERAVADRHGDRKSGVGDLLPAHQTLGGVHRDGAHRRFAELLGDLEHQAIALVGGLERVEDRRQVPVEFDVDHGADDLGDVSDRIGHIVLVLRSAPVATALPRRR